MGIFNKVWDFLSRTRTKEYTKKDTIKLLCVYFVGLIILLVCTFGLVTSGESLFFLIGGATVIVVCGTIIIKEIKRLLTLLK